MNKRGKSWRFFAMAALIIAFSLSALFGFSYQYGDTKTTYVKARRTSVSASISAAALT